ncbi:MAG: fatty acyl-AMP ligase [Oscillatoria sp. SIO1A7]|nr:fatty acyl-AMP ligase [Oscillatoria sp. SIO1A7]
MLSQYKSQKPSDREYNRMPNYSTIVSLLRDRATSEPDKIGYSFLGEDGETVKASLTYQELDRQARAIAAQLQNLGAAGERALLIYPFSQGLEFVAGFFGCLYAGVTAVTTYPPRPNQSLSGFEARAASCQAKFVLATKALLANLEGKWPENTGLAECQKLATDSIPSSLAEEWQEPDLNKDYLAFLQYTSGSTGNPKGVIVTHENILHNSAQIYKCFGHSTNSQGVIWLPAYHDMGLIGGIIQPLYGGFPVALMSPMTFLQKPLSWLKAISRYKATTSGGPNFAYDLCARKATPELLETLDLSSWEVAFSGAEPVRAKTLEQFAIAYKACGFRHSAFYPCYGMAETTLLVSGGLKDDPPAIKYVEELALEQNRVVPAEPGKGARAIVSCGRGWLGQEILIVDPDTLTICPSDRIGEIWVSGSSVGKGYWNQPEETKRTFNGYLADTGDGPFLRTGDFGFWADGELFIAGRLKDMIIIWGRNQYPQNIEMTVEQSHPALRPGASAAFAVEAEEEERLVIVQEVERAYLKKLNAEETIEAIRSAIAQQHELETYAVLLIKTGSIPKTSSGKVQRHACRTKFLDGSLNVVARWQNPSVDIGGVLERLIPAKEVSQS